MNLTALEQALRDRLGVVTNDSYFSTSVLDGFINEANRKIATTHDWPWLQIATTFPTVAGTETYTPASGWTRTKALTIDPYDPLQLLPLKEIRGVSATLLDRPLAYVIFADKIVLRPVPDGVYTVQHDYITKEPVLSAGSDTPLMPDAYHEAIVEQAAYYALMRNRESDRAAGAGQAAAEWIKVMQDNTRRSSSPLKVRVRPGFQGPFG